MFSTEKRTAIPVAIFAALLMICGSIVAISGSSNAATGEDLSGYGSVNEIMVAPGYSWSYTATFPSDLTEGTVLSFEVNELNTNASIDGHNLSIIIPQGFTPGKYNIVLKATHEESNQTGYQWIRITVNEALALSYTGCINEIIQGASQMITLNATGGVGTVTWKEVSLPQGLTLSGNTVSGTPTTIGLNTIQVQAESSEGQKKNLEITFTVFNVIVGGNDETITSTGSYVASTAIAQTGTDLGVTWSVTSGELPAGLQLDAATGVVSGTYTGTEAIEAEIVLTGSATNGPAQTATKNLTIKAEPAFSLSGDNSILTYTGNTETKTASVSASANTSEITWTVNSLAGVSISNGVITVTGSAAVTSGQTITVTATTAYGQVRTMDVNLVVEDTLRITGPASLVSTQGVSATSSAFDITGGSDNTVAITNNGGYASGLAYDSETKTLSISYPDPHAKSTVTLTVTSAAGQTATIDVSVTVFSSMGFTSEPGSDGIYAYIEDEA